MVEPDPQAGPPVPMEEWEGLDDLRPRWAALAVVTTLAGFSDSCWADEVGWHHEDGDGNAIHLILAPEGRAVLYGRDHEVSVTTARGEEIDVVTQAPDWVRGLVDPWHGELDAERPGFVYWLDDDTWERVAYPGDPDEPEPDGASAVGRFMFDDDQAVIEVLDWATQWVWDAAGAEWDGDEPELVAAGHALIDDLRTPGEERQAVETFLAVLAPGGVVADIDSAADSAADFAL